MGKSLSYSRRKRIFDITKGHCFYCGCVLDFNNFHADHFVAKSKGGEAKQNLVPACPECNLVKGNKDVEEFRRTIFNYLHTDLHVRMLDKFLPIVRHPIKFYFEVKRITLK